MDECIDRSKIRDPREVSGWGAHEDGRNPQDFSDIARRAEKKPEFERGHTLHAGRADGTAHEAAGAEDGG